VQHVSDIENTGPSETENSRCWASNPAPGSWWSSLHLSREQFGCLFNLSKDKKLDLALFTVIPSSYHLHNGTHATTSPIPFMHWW